MNYEQKYKEALERMKSWARGEHPECFSEAQKAAEFIFPELKESEDEQSKKWILEYLYDGLRRTDEQFKDQFKAAIAWLEKQGEHAEVEPKFHEGDWIVLPLGIIAHIDSLNSTDYQVTTTDGKICDFKISKQDNYRLWEITDAKDGDVLVDAYGNIGIFEKCDDFDWMSCCSLGNNGGFQYFTVEHENEKTYPATKEQIELLFQKMKEAGWEWDAEKKEANKIEQKPADKTEPMFKVGDWFVNNIRKELFLIKSINNGYYTLEDIKGNIISPCLPPCESDSHLWSIADAKDGDVLVCESGWTCIFKTLVNDENFSSYCFMDDTKWFCETGSDCHTLNKEFMKAYNGEIKPATKEQRDALMKAMADAGWEFDFEKKKLRKSLYADKVIERLNNQACLTMTNEEYRTFFDNYIPTVTQALAMKWLREIYCIIITIDYNEDEDCEDNERYGFTIYYKNERDVGVGTHPTYEQAVEAALKYCLTYMI